MGDRASDSIRKQLFFHAAKLIASKLFYRMLENVAHVRLLDLGNAKVFICENVVFFNVFYFRVHPEMFGHDYAHKYQNLEYNISKAIQNRKCQHVHVINVLRYIIGQIKEKINKYNISIYFFCFEFVWF